MAEKIPEDFKDLFGKVAYANIATVMPDGTPQVTPVWFDYGGNHLRLNSAKGRVKDKNMRRNKNVALSIQDPDNAYRYLAVRGKVDDITEEALSSQRHLEYLNCPITVGYGSQETPEFQRQGREFVAAIKAAGKPVKLIVGEGFNHFEMQETFGNPYGLAGRAALELMNLQMRSS